MTAADATTPAPEAARPAETQARRRTLAAIARARVVNAWLRIGACAVVSLVATSLVNNVWPLVWWAGLVVFALADRQLYRRLQLRAEAGEPLGNLRGLVIWTALQSTYNNVMAAMLWFAPYVPGETLALLFICGGLANAAATLRAHPALACAGAAPTIVALLGLPIAEYFIHGARNPTELTPLVGGLLLLGFGINLWRSLVASDAAQAQAEAAVLRERQAAAAAAAAKSDTIKRMNDELRTPMSALIGAAQHLHRAAATPQARAHIATLVQAGEVLKLVLDDLSDLDRLENGRIPIELKSADPRELVRGVVAAFKAAAKDKNLELFADIAPDAPAFVAIDAARVRQVLFNLIANGVRYTTQGGVRVRLSVQPYFEGRVRLTFIVADTGAGMSRTQLARVLGRDRLCAEGDGPGLGLAISTRLAKLMGGKIEGRSEPGQGSVFAFTLDAALATPRASAPSAA